MSGVTIHHVQVAMAEDGEQLARTFYGRVLGFSEIPKPESLAGRGGVWFQVGEVQLHLGVERPFSPAKKAHVGYLVESLASPRTALTNAGCLIIADNDLPGFERFYTEDPFGNRVEILSRRTASF